MIKAPRQEQIGTIKKESPKKRAVDIARELGITRQRASQILKRLGYPPARLSRPKRYCANCGKRLSRQTAGNLCLACYRANLSSVNIELACPQCGKTFNRKKSYVIWARKEGQQHFFCSLSCRAKWMPRHRRHSLKKEESHEDSISASRIDFIVFVPLGILRKGN